MTKEELAAEEAAVRMELLKEIEEKLNKVYILVRAYEKSIAEDIYGKY